MNDRGSRVNLGLAQSLGPEGPPVFDFDPSEWETLWISARDHCLVPYFHKYWLESGRLGLLPTDIARKFSSGRKDNEERNRRLLTLLDELISVLGKKGIATLVSKGLPLAQTCYGDLGLRVLYDLDLFVKPEEAGRALDVLRGIGYEPFFPERGSEPGRPLWRPRKYSWDAESVFDPDRPVMVELHTRPWEPNWHGFRLGCRTDHWQGERPLEIGGITVRIPAEERLLVQLAVHYACNVLECSARLMHLLDIVLLLRQHDPGIDWKTVLGIVHENSLEPFCFIALDLAGRAGGCRIPDRVWNDLQSETPPGIVNWSALRGTRDVCSMGLRNRDRSLIYFLHWSMAGTWSDKASVLIDSMRRPWVEGVGPGRWKSLATRMSGRLRHLAHAMRAR